MSSIKVFAVDHAGGDFRPMDVVLPDLPSDHVEIEVESCGICHSDLSMRDNEWEITQYPFVGGHEVVGRIVAVGDQTSNHSVGDRVGVGWLARSCMKCSQCLNGDQNLCLQAEGTITHQNGGFAERVRCHWVWAAAIPDSLPADKCGPLLCGGLTVFNPLIQHNLSPTARVGVVGIGGLGHLSLQFLNAWGCEVTAISRSRSKEENARRLGAHEFFATNEDPELEAVAGKFDFILNTTDAMLPWDAYVRALSPRGILHTVGAAPKIEASVFPMIMGQKSLSSSPVGSVTTTETMFQFCARHKILPDTEVFGMDDINDAFKRLKETPPLRLVLKR